MGTPTFDGPEPEDPDLLPDPEEAGGDLAERRDLEATPEEDTLAGGSAPAGAPAGDSAPAGDGE